MPRSVHARRASALTALIVLTLVWATPARSAPGPVLKVMTYNVYYGAALETLFAATPETLPFFVDAIWTEVQETDLPSRAEAVADQIAAFDPHVVGLQETPLWRSQFPGDFVFSPAATVEYDFLELLLNALEERGRSYEAVAVVENLDAELFRFDANSPTGIEDIRLTDRDVVIVRTDLPESVYSVSNPQSANFEQNLVFPFGVFQGVEVPRGWNAIDVTLSGETVRVINTHLERFSPFHQEAQAQEIIDGPADTSLSVVLLGDLNTAAGEGGVPGQSLTDTYEIFTEDSGFGDAWSDKHASPGLTCCQTSDLDDPSALSERIDFVLIHGDLVTAASTRVGEEEADRTTSGLWPSDHVGVSAMLRV